MSRMKSLLKTMEITEAGRRHSCRRDEGHIIAKGQKRLTISEDGDKQNYCLDCAKKMMAQSLGKLSQLNEDLDRLA